MQTWYVAFKESPARSVVTTVLEQGNLGSEALKRFDAMAKSGKCQDREIFGMWIVDYDTKQQDVLRCFGNVPLGYERRHENWKSRHKLKAVL